MGFKAGLRSWCMRHGINHRAFGDDELIAMRLASRKWSYVTKEEVN